MFGVFLKMGNTDHVLVKVLFLTMLFKKKYKRNILKYGTFSYAEKGFFHSKNTEKINWFVKSCDFADFSDVIGNLLIDYVDFYRMIVILYRLSV